MEEALDVDSAVVVHESSPSHPSCTLAASATPLANSAITS